MVSSAAPQPASASALVLQREQLRAAAHWHALLHECPPDSAQWQSWQRWRDADPAHLAAWQQLEALQLALAPASGALAGAALRTAAANPERRRLIHAIALGIAGGAIAYPAYQWIPFGVYGADYRTASGKTQHVRLADGSEIWLGADSALNVTFSASRRELSLLRGELVIATGKDPRPLQIRTAHALLEPLGTRFAVSQWDEQLDIAVFANQVRVRRPDGAQRVLNAGEALRVSAAGFGALQRIQEADFAAWREGLLVLQQTPLAEVLAKLGAWRSGLVQCDPAIAHLPVSGVLSLHDTDAALAQLARSLPLRMVYRSRWWVRVQPHTR